jgi:hypothetical protein
MKTRFLSALVLGALLSFSGTAARAAQPAETALQAPTFSGGIGDVVKLAQSGVTDSVIVAYIKNSPGPFQPNADEVLRLHDLGISSAVITAMLERGAELRRQAASMPPAGYPAYGPPGPSSDTQAPTSYVETASAEPASSVVYIGSSYPVYTYPYYSYYWYYPYGYYPYGYCGYHPYYRSGYYSRYRSGYYHGYYRKSGQDFHYLEHPNYYPWYSGSSGYRTPIPQARTGGLPGRGWYNGTVRQPVAVTRPSAARVSGGRPAYFAGPRASPPQMTGARMGAVRTPGARMGGMPLSGARFGGGMPRR